MSSKSDKRESLLLLGHSLGGVLAHEIALIFNHKHLRVPLVVMFDSWAVGQELIWPEKAKQFDRFHHFAPNQLNSLANGAEKLAGFLRKHHFTSNIEHSPEIWLFTAEEKTKLMFRPLKINSLYGPSTQLLIIQRLQKLGSVKMADWLVYRNFLEQADLNTFVHERMAGWHIDPRCRAVTREVGTVLHRTAYYTCSQDILGCTARLKIVTETSTTASREFIIGTVLIGRGGHTNHPPFEMGRMEAFIDGRQV
uniref:Thioesterase domain-containing protein n=1 Tax=Meloidogyne hapla TaxID=6305 RepID=A0A1I8BBR3_MELHA